MSCISTEERYEDMRSIIIHSDSGTSIEEILLSTDIEKWLVVKKNLIGQTEVWFVQDNIEVRVSIVTDNIARTVNVCPADQDRDQDLAKEILISLSKALTKAGIENSIEASLSDLGMPWDPERES